MHLRLTLALLAATALCARPAMAAPSAPSDSSLAQLQQQDQKANDAQQDEDLAIVKHSIILVQSIIGELEHAHLKFDDMQMALNTPNSLPSPSSIGVVFGVASQSGQPIHYLGDHNEIAYTALGTKLLVAFQPANGTPVLLSFNSDGMISFGSGDIDADEVEEDPEDYVAGSIDQTITADIKQDVKNSLDPTGSDSDDDQSDQTGASDQGNASSDSSQAANTANSRLSGADRDAIDNHARPCWTIDAGAPGVAGFHVMLSVTTDATGTVREAVVAPQDQGKLSDPFFNAYAQRAIAAVENYECATLPLPSYMLGHNQTFTFEFSP
jgi:hypothetical protein